MSVGVRNVRPGCYVAGIHAVKLPEDYGPLGPCRAWPEGVEPPSVFGHPDCYQCARFTRIPEAPTKE